MQKTVNQRRDAADELSAMNQPNAAGGLSAEQIDFFNAQGYLIVGDVIDADTLGALESEYDDVLARVCAAYACAGRYIPRENGGDFAARYTELICAAPDAYQHLDISLPLTADLAAFAERWEEIAPGWRDGGGGFDPGVFCGEAVFNLLTNPRLLDIAESIIGGEIYCNPTQHTRIKPPQRLLPRAAEIDANMSRTLWHQDEAVVTAAAKNTEILTVWTAQTDATVANGCMYCVPESHKDEGGDPATGLTPHCPGAGDMVGEIYIGDAQIDKQRLVPLEVPAGGIVLLHRRIIHGAMANTSPDLRWSFDLRYQRPGMPTGRECFPGFIARSRENPAAAQTDPAAYRRAWLAARDGIISGDIPAVFNERWDKYARTPLCA